MLLHVLFQKFFDLMMRIPESSFVSRTEYKVLLKCRKILIRLYDPLIRYRLDGLPILLPLSHNLPYFRKKFPQYSTNIVRIARHMSEKYHNIKFIDIGANVGDTAAILRSSTHFPILCIEGNDEFMTLLQENTSQLSDIQIVHSFVGNFTGGLVGTIDNCGGTAHLVQDEQASNDFKMQTLSDILEEHPKFSHAKMLKVDTDGYDCLILESELQLLSRLKPVIFFEYDPYWFRFNGDGFQIFSELYSIGYQHALVYENNGDYLLSADLGNTDLIEDIHEFYSGRGRYRYCDVCVFHQEDSEMWGKIRSSEKEFFRNVRKPF